MNPLCIGIAGGSASGKTTVVRAVQRAYGRQVTVISHDSYYKSQDHKPMEERVRQNYDHPDAFETDRLVQDLRELRAGRAVSCPVYDFSRHTRSGETRLLQPAPFLVVEGILILSDPALRDLLDYTLFLDTPQEVRTARRLERDQRERGRSVESIRRQLAETVDPMYEAFVEPSKRYADRVFCGEDSAFVAQHLLLWMKAHAGHPAPAGWW